MRAPAPTIAATLIGLLLLPLTDGAFACPLAAAECAGMLRHASELGSDLERLERGEVLVSYREIEDESGGTAFVIAGSRIVDASRDEVWSVLTDFEAWPDFLPNLDSIAVEEIRPDKVVKLHERTTSAGRTFSFTATRTIDARRGLLWDELDRSRPHDFEALSGFWQVMALDDGRTLVRMQTRLELGFYVPGFLRRRILAASVPDALEAVAGEVASRRAGSFDVVSVTR